MERDGVNGCGRRLTNDIRFAWYLRARAPVPLSFLDRFVCARSSRRVGGDGGGGGDDGGGGVE